MSADFVRKLATLVRSSDSHVVRAAGRVWHLTPAGLEQFGPTGPQPESWIADGTAVVVKSNPVRTVYRAELPGGTVFVKHCRVVGPRAWTRELIRPPKARLEFDKVVALRRRGIPTAEPLAWGAADSLLPGESLLITRGIGAVPFVEFLERDFATLPPEEQQGVARQLTLALAGLFARLHDAGITHPDPHPGNLLVAMSPCRVPQLSLIDVHDVVIGRPLSWERSRANLALFNRYFQLRTDRPHRTRFWHLYRRSRQTLATPTGAELREQARELERETLASNCRLWAGRAGRRLRAHREIGRVEHGNLRGFAVRDLPEGFLRELLRDPDAAFTQPGARLVKDCVTSTVAAIPFPTPTGTVPVILKRVNVRGWADPLKNLLRPSQVMRSWVNGHSLRDRHLPTPRPLAVFHRYRRGIPAEGYLVTEVVPEGVQLDAAVRGGVGAESLVRLARVLRAMHDRGVSHRDLKASNVLLAHGTDPVLIDLVGVRTGVRLAAARRARELARLNASFAAGGSGLRLSERLRFLRAYLDAGPSFEEGWKSWWGLVSRATAAKVARNRRVGRVLG